jgi:hypothetical protein
MTYLFGLLTVESDGIVTQPYFEYNTSERLPTQELDMKQLDIYSKDHEVRTIFSILVNLQIELIRQNLHASTWQMYYFLSAEKQKYDAISEFKIFADHLLDHVY